MSMGVTLQADLFLEALIEAGLERGDACNLTVEIIWSGNWKAWEPYKSRLGELAPFYNRVTEKYCSMTFSDEASAKELYDKLRMKSE